MSTTLDPVVIMHRVKVESAGVADCGCPDCKRRAMDVARSMTGFLASLTPEQLTAALAYTGDDMHGDPEFLLSGNDKSPASLSGQRG